MTFRLWRCLFIRAGLHTFTFIIDRVINCEMVVLNSVQVSFALFQICERFLQGIANEFSIVFFADECCVFQILFGLEDQSQVKMDGQC